MNVVHIVPAPFGPHGVVGGAERYALELARQMADRVPTTLVTFGAIVAFFRMVSLASIVAALFAALFAFWLFGVRPITAVVAVMALMLIVRHHANIGRILRGEESKLGRKTA